MELSALWYEYDRYPEVMHINLYIYLNFMNYFWIVWKEQIGTCSTLPWLLTLPIASLNLATSKRIFKIEIERCGQQAGITPIVLSQLRGLVACQLDYIALIENHPRSPP